MTREKALADFARSLIRSMGHRVPSHWTDKDVLLFIQSMVNDREVEPDPDRKRDAEANGDVPDRIERIIAEYEDTPKCDGGGR